MAQVTRADLRIVAGMIAQQLQSLPWRWWAVVIVRAVGRAGWIRWERTK